MPEEKERVKYKFVIDRKKRNGKIVLLTVRRKATRDYTPLFYMRIRPPVPLILFKTPEFIKEFVDCMNRGIIKLK